MLGGVHGEHYTQSATYTHDWGVSVDFDQRKGKATTANCFQRLRYKQVCEAHDREW